MGGKKIQVGFAKPMSAHELTQLKKLYADIITDHEAQSRVVVSTEQKREQMKKSMYKIRESHIGKNQNPDDNM